MTYYFRGLYSEITKWANPKVLQHWTHPFSIPFTECVLRLGRGRVQGAPYTSHYPMRRRMHKWSPFVGTSSDLNGIELHHSLPTSVKCEESVITVYRKKATLPNRLIFQVSALLITRAEQPNIIS